MALAIAHISSLLACIGVASGGVAKYICINKVLISFLGIYSLQQQNRTDSTCTKTSGTFQGKGVAQIQTSSEQSRLVLSFLRRRKANI